MLTSFSSKVKCDRLLGRLLGSFGSLQVQVYVFVLTASAYISFLTHFAITSLVIFAELCTLLCYEVLLTFR